MKYINQQDLDTLLWNNKAYYHHTSYARGYISRKMIEGGYIEKYNGKFGKGYKVYAPCFRSTQYCYITYYII